MIEETTFTKDQIHQISNEYKKSKKRADPALIEKATKALHLLESLTLTDLRFVFKGGTALLLLLDEMHRFSIDIDIIIEKNKDEENMDAVLEQVIANSRVFQRHQEHARTTNQEIPKGPIKFFIHQLWMELKTISFQIFCMKKVVTQRSLRKTSTVNLLIILLRHDLLKYQAWIAFLEIS